jgi:putative membrane protein
MFTLILKIVADSTQNNELVKLLEGFSAGAGFEYTDYLIIKIEYMKTVIFSSFLALSLGLCSCNNNGEKHQDTVDSAKTVNKEVKAVQPDASNFAVNAANGGMMEVILGKIAQEKASSPRVKAFGEMMVKDHTEANDNLKAIATTLNIAVPDSVSDDTKKEIDHMKMKKGKDFDKAYVKMMVEDHKKDIAEFRKCADNCSDSTIKSFASNTLPVLEKHLDSIQAIAGKKP